MSVAKDDPKIISTKSSFLPTPDNSFPQFWSVRQQKRTSGSVDVGAHFKAWQSSGLRLGSHDYQIVATEGYQSSGRAEVTVG